MKQLTVIILSAVMLLALGVQVMAATPGEKAPVLDTDKAKTSYSLGFNMAQSLKFFKDMLDKDILVAGIKDGLKGDSKASKLPEEEMRKLIMAFQQKAQSIMQKKKQVDGETNKKEGEAFLKANGVKKGVKTTKSGLQYTVVKEGKGVNPKATDVVKVHYKGTLINGTEFDSSYKRGQPTEFPLNRVVPGWTEGIQLMKAGAKYKFFIPSKLGYGPRGAGQQIGPNSTLIFEVELLEIKPPQAKPKGPAPKVQPKKK